MEKQQRAMSFSELLAYIDKSALSEETQSTPELQRIFIKYYKLKDQQLDRALNELFQNLHAYQFDMAFRTPEFVWRIVQDLSRPDSAEDSLRVGSLLSWFRPQ